MTTGFSTAATGMIWAQKGMDVTANNLANVSTIGFKSDKTSFADLLYTQLHGSEIRPDLKVGHGSKMNKTDTLYESCSMDHTGQPLDFALTNQRDFFAVRTANGQIHYTRDGHFILSKHGDGKFYLADSVGNTVVGPGPMENSERPNLSIFTFRNLDGLEKVGGNGYMATDRSGPATPVPDGNYRQGYLESSQTDLATELSNVITQSRAYELDAKMVSMTDEVMQTINSLR